MGTPHKWADAIKAFADGEAIEWRSGGGDWQPLYGPPDFSVCEWRRKPKQRLIRYRLYLAEGLVGFRVRVAIEGITDLPPKGLTRWLTDWTTTELISELNTFPQKDLS